MQLSIANTAIMQVKNLSVVQGEKLVLESLSFSVPSGGVLMSIIGPNGAGKTTLLKSLLGLLPLERGRVEFPGFMGVSGEKQRMRPRLAYVPQRNTVEWDFPINVFDLVLMGTYGDLGWCRRPGAREHAIALGALRRVGMEGQREKHISELSGGQAQRIFLARALAQRADIYLLDEPFAGVDVKAERAIFEVLQQLKAEAKTLLVVHHDLATVKQYFDWALFLNVRKVAEGAVKQVFNSEVIEKTYSAYSPKRIY